MNKKFTILSAVFLVIAIVAVGSAFLQPQKAEAATSASNAARLGITVPQYVSLSNAFYLVELHTQVVSLQLDQAVLSMRDELQGMSTLNWSNMTTNERAANIVEINQIGVRVNYLSNVANSLNQIKSLENSISFQLYN